MLLVSLEYTGAVSFLSGGKRLGHKPRSAHEEISPAGAAYRRSSRQPSASISAPLAALFLVLLCWALCMRTLCAPIRNKQLDLTCALRMDAGAEGGGVVVL